MRDVNGAIVLSPSDLSNFLHCRHRTGLDLAAARGVLTRPSHVNPYSTFLQQLGNAHEQRYVESLRAAGLSVFDLKDKADAHELTRSAMRDGADVIVQAHLKGADLAGYADVLLRVERPSELGTWSYEVQDTKLARKTKGATMVQLAAYSELLAAVQGRAPAEFQVITPDPAQPVQAYRVEDYAAYYRMVLTSLREAIGRGHEALMTAHYPEPVDACAVCRWEPRCVGRRRADDHLSFIANTSATQRAELTARGHPTLAKAAEMCVPVRFTPSRGARETYGRIGDQARVQHQQRTEGRPIYERLPIVPNAGLCLLPAPSAGDVFLDLEGARFAREGGREYLFGLHANGSYRCWWAANDAEERMAFEQVMDAISEAWARDPAMHVYHFNHYEVSALKRLMGRYATHAEPLNELLRAGRFVDLYPITRQAIRAGVESYSIKKLELFSHYVRRVELSRVHDALLAIEIALESNAGSAIAPEIRTVVQGYNEDDCRSNEALRNWLESVRAQAVEAGESVPRRELKDASDSTAPSDLQAEELRRRLLDGLDPQASNPEHPNHPRWLLGYLVDFHKREENAAWWEYYRLKELPDEDLHDEPSAIADLVFTGRLGYASGKNGKPTKSVIDRYTYPFQEVEIGRKGKVFARDGKTFGEIRAHDRSMRLIDIQKGPSRAELHPDAVFAADVIPTKTLQKALMRLAERWLSASLAGPESDAASSCGFQLLHRVPPRLKGGNFDARQDESAQQFAVRIVTTLDRTTLAIQGPPGAGKTHVGAEMVRALVGAGKKIGVCAVSYRVIRNLLDEVLKQAREHGEEISVALKVSDESESTASVVKEFTAEDAALTALASGEVRVLGGTTWLWACEEAFAAVDVLFVDEAAQMSLANVLAVSHATDSLVLLGDPQQLEQPLKAAHPDGVGISALHYVLGGAETMPGDRGIFLPVTWRMSPAITRFTSELFYDGKLAAEDTLVVQELRGTGRYDGSHLWLVSVSHDGNQTASSEEVDVVATLVDELTRGSWVDQHGAVRPLTRDDIRVVAPFNAQVNRLVDRLGASGAPVGTVDRFQGQTAAVVIYSMTTSRPEDAPRGLEFLYSLNRLNVATSRARCAVFLVASPRLFEPACRTPRQMRLANALCRYREMSMTSPEQ
jgi:predicted RecB family nuclease